MATEWITVEVGGEKFVTTRGTLCSHGGYFAAVLGETGSAMKDSSSGLYVDRDGTPFRHILSWMRSGRLPYAVSTDMAQLDALADEARFYALAALEQQCEQAMMRLAAEKAHATLRSEADRRRPAAPRITEHKIIFQYEIGEPYHANDRLIAMSNCLEKLDSKINKMIAEGWQPLGPCQTFWDTEDPQTRLAALPTAGCALNLPPHHGLSCPQWQPMPAVVCECLQAMVKYE